MVDYKSLMKARTKIGEKGGLEVIKRATLGAITRKVVDDKENLQDAIVRILVKKGLKMEPATKRASLLYHVMNDFIDRSLAEGIISSKELAKKE